MGRKESARGSLSISQNSVDQKPLTAVGLADRQSGGENQPERDRYDDRASPSIPEVSKSGKFFSAGYRD